MTVYYKGLRLLHKPAQAREMEFPRHQVASSGGIIWMRASQDGKRWADRHMITVFTGCPDSQEMRRRDFGRYLQMESVRMIPSLQPVLEPSRRGWSPLNLMEGCQSTPEQVMLLQKLFQFLGYFSVQFQFNEVRDAAEAELFVQLLKFDFPFEEYQ